MQKVSSSFANGVVPYSVLVGKIILGRRKSLAMDQTQLATALGLSQSAYSRLESGDSIFSVSQLRTAAQVLQCSPNQILGEADKLEKRLTAEGVKVISEKPADKTSAMIGLGLLIALLAAGS